MERYEIEGKTVLITGAAKGIGRDTARRLADRGAQLALIDRDAEGVEHAPPSLDPGRSPSSPTVAERDSIAAAIAAARKRFGGDRRGGRKRRDQRHAAAVDCWSATRNSSASSGSTCSASGGRSRACSRT